MLFVVSYTLNPARVNKPLSDELMRSAGGWMHYFDNSWLIATNENENQVYERIKPFFLNSDLFLIIEIKFSSKYYGWLPKEGWDWIKDKYERGWASRY